MFASAAAMAYVSSPESVSAESPGYQQVIDLPPAIAPPLLLREVDSVDALSINRSIPFSAEPNPAARPFKIRGDDAAYNRALECLTTAIYYEAGSETPDGQRAVAQVVLNRVRHPAFAPGVCAVVYHGSLRTTGCQFSFTCDGSLRRTPSTSGWAKARAIAAQALAGAVFKPVGHATHYHADYVVPYWATSLSKNALLGKHIFYRWPGWWGQPAAFGNRHSGKEIDPRMLRLAALRRQEVRGEPASWSSEQLVVGADPTVELMSIIDLIAAEPPASEPSTPYEEEVREHFSAYSDHLAVQIYRQLSSGDSKFDSSAFLETLMHYSEPPQLELRGPLKRELLSAIGGKGKLAGFISALRDFVKHSDFETFFQDRQTYYAQLEAEARQPALALVAKVERESGTAVQPVRFILAPLLSSSSSSSSSGACRPLAKKGAEAWVIVGLRDSLNLPSAEPDQLRSALATSQRQCVS